MRNKLASIITSFAITSAIISPVRAGVIQTLYADKDTHTAWVQLLGDITWFSGNNAMSEMLRVAMASNFSTIGYNATPPDQFGYRYFNFLEFSNPLGANFVEAPGRIYSIRAIESGTPNTWYQEDFGTKNGAVAFVRFNGPFSWPPSGHLAIGSSQIETAMSALSRDLQVTYAEGCIYVLVSDAVEPICNLFEWIQVDQ